MGQQGSYQSKPIPELIKDVAQFNLMAKTPNITSQLGFTISASINKVQPANLVDKLITKRAQTNISLELIPENKVVQLQEQEFYTLMQLLETLATVQVDVKEEGMCEICFEAEIDRSLPCGHGYCESCVTSWFIVKDKNSCPMCRAQLTKQQMQQSSYNIPNDKELVHALKDQIKSLLF